MMRSARHGQVLVFFLGLMTIGLLLSIGILSFQANVVHEAKFRSQQLDATYLAEAGLEYGINKLAQDSVVDTTEITLGQGTFIVQDVTGSGNERTLESIGYIPNAAAPKTQKRLRVKVTLDSDDVQFFYGIQVDSGGLSMGNNSVVNGNIFSNGNIIGNAGATITGDATVAGGLTETPTLEWATHNSDQLFATVNGNRDIAQSFTATADGTLGKVSVYLAKVGNPTANLTLWITTDDGDKPDTSDLASATIAYSTVGSTASWIDVSFSSAPTLSNGTKYWIVLDYGSSSGTNHWNWRKDGTDGYASNTGKYTSNWNSGGASWTNVGGDLAFRAWIGGTTNRIESVTVGDADSGTARAESFVNTTVHGSACPNEYCIVESPARENLPVSDGVIADWKNDAAAGGTQTGEYKLDNGETASLGPKKIDGKLVLDNNAILTVTGTIWVTGDIELSNNCEIHLDAGYGGASGVIITDGKLVISNNCLFVGSGNPSSYIMALTAKDSTNEEIMTIDNGSTGVIYYAGKGRIKFSNNATAKEATAYGMTLDNNAEITYDSGLASAYFTSGPGGGWSIQKGTLQNY